jgi:fermentation-respiration switch protein FrsA (DUF1100 family)
VIVTLAFVLTSTVLFLLPEFLLFHPNRQLASTPADFGVAFERVEVETRDGERLVGWYVEADPHGPLADRPGVIVYCHGNAGNISGRVAQIPTLRGLGLSVFFFDYRGYGESSGSPTVAGTRLDIEAVWDYLIERYGYEPAQIALWGRSLGGAIAIDQAARASAAGTPPRALIVESTFTSTLDIGQELYPWLPVRWFARRLDYPSRELIAEVTAPTLIAHSPDDDLIPASHATALLEAAREGRVPESTFEALTGGHNDGNLGEPAHLHAVLELLR